MRKQSDKRNNDNYIKLHRRQKHKLHVKQSDCKQVPSGSSNNSSSNSSGSDSGSGTCNHNGAAAATQVVAAGTGSYYSGNPDNIQKYFLPNLQYEVLELLPKVAHKHTHIHKYILSTHTHLQLQSCCTSLRWQSPSVAHKQMAYAALLWHIQSHTHLHSHTVVYCCSLPLLVARWVHIIFNFHAYFAIWFASLSRK